jgi:hypothetical protein
MKPMKTLFGIKLLRQSLKSLNGQFKYSYAKGRFGKQLEVPGNGSYVAVTGGLSAGGLGPVAVAVECDLDSEVFPTIPPPKGVRCFGRVRVRLLNSCAKRLLGSLLKEARELSRKVVSDPQAAYEYACVLKGRFPAGEAAIAKEAYWSYWYAYEVLKSRFPAGEAAIAANNYWASEYAALKFGNR